MATQFGGFSASETLLIGQALQPLANGRNITRSIAETSKNPIHQTQILSATKLPNVVPALQDNKVIYKFDWHNVGRPTGSLPGQAFYGNDINSYPKVFTFNHNSYTTTDLNLGLDSKFDSQILKTEVDTDNNGPNDTKFHVEVVSDYSSENTTDWIAYGYWLQVPTERSLTLSDYSPGTFSVHNNKYGSMPTQVTGTATYEGSMLGLHSSVKNNELKLSRFTGKATITTNFDAGTAGTFSVLLNELKLDGQSVSGSIGRTNLAFSFSSVNTGITTAGLRSGHATINNVEYLGHIMTVTTGPKPNNTTAPTGIQGAVHGKTSDGNKSFIAAFGAKKTE